MENNERTIIIRSLDDFQQEIQKISSCYNERNITILIGNDIVFNQKLTISNIQNKVIIIRPADGLQTAVFSGGKNSFVLTRLSAGSDVYKASGVTFNTEYPILTINGVEARFETITEKEITFQNPLYHIENVYYTIEESITVSTDCEAAPYIMQGTILVFKHKWIHARYVVRSVAVSNNGFMTVTFYSGEEDYFVYNREFGWGGCDDPYSTAIIDIINPRLGTNEAQTVANLSPGRYVIGSNGTVYYRNEGGSAFDTLTAEYPSGPGLLIDIIGCSCITFEGITFADNGVKRITHRASHVQAEEDALPCVHVESSHDIKFDKCEFTRIMGYCVGVNRVKDYHQSWMYDTDGTCQNIDITNCYVHDTYGGGFHLHNCNQCIVGNNLIKNIGLLQKGAVGVLQRCNCYGNKIRRNSIYNAPYSGISAGWSWATDMNTERGDLGSAFNTIEANHVHHCMREMTDGAAIYHLGPGAGTVICDNVVHNVGYDLVLAQGGSDPDALERCYDKIAIYLDEMTSGVECKGNVCYRVGTFMRMNSPHLCHIHHNIFAYSILDGFGIGASNGDGTQTRSFVMTNNVIRMPLGQILQFDSGARARTEYLLDGNLFDDRGRLHQARPAETAQERSWHYGNMTPLFDTSSSLFFTTNQYIIPNPNVQVHPVNIDGFRLFMDDDSDFNLTPALQGTDYYGIDNNNPFHSHNLTESEAELGW